MRPHTPPYLQSEDSEEDGSDGTDGRVVVAELVAKDTEELTALREAWGGLPAGPAKVAAREAYFKFLLSWRWELKPVDSTMQSGSTRTPMPCWCLSPC